MLCMRSDLIQQPGTFRSRYYHPIALHCLAPSTLAGGLGLMVASWLVQRLGPGFIRLLSRSGHLAEGSSTAALAATAGCITCAMADAGSPGDAAVALEAGGQLGPAVQAVMHASGVLADSLLDKQTAGSFR